MSDARTIESRRIHAGKVLELRVERVEMPNGKLAELELIRHRGAAAIVALDDEGRAIMVRQYRHAVGEWLLEIPAGKLDEGEDPADCVRRELAEETGFSPRELEALGWIYTTPGFTNERIWLFLARSVEPAEQRLEDDEVLEVERLPFDEAVERALDGGIRDGKSVSALLRAASRLADGDAG
jgi:ADP-ribose pyrophosphatase